MLSSRKTLAVRWALIAAVLAFVLGAKLRMIDAYGSDLPYWDQWDAEGDNLYRPYLQQQLTFTDLVQPHNEHRTFFTRVFMLGIFEANDRQWNARVEVVGSAVLHTGVALLVLAFALHALPLGAAAACAGVIAVFFGMNVSWENTLSGFQATFYFLLLFSLLHLAGTLLARPRSWGWWLAPLAGLATLLSMASGLLSAIAIICVTGLRGVRDRRFTREDVFVISTNGVLTVAGWLLKTDVPGHAELKAQSVGVWLNAWLHQLTWPVGAPGLPWPALLGLIPPLAILWAYVRRAITGPAALTLLAAAAWHVMQTMAIAYARGAHDAGYTSRYTDTLAIGVVINLLALAYLAAHCPTPSLRRQWTATALVCGAFSLNGLWVQSNATESNTLLSLPEINAARIETVRAYIVRRDPAFFHKTAWNELPYPDAVRLAQLLDEPTIRAILPPSVAPPIALEAEPSSTGFAAYSETATPGPSPVGLSAWAAAKPGPALFRSKPFTTRHARVTLFVSSGPHATGRIRLVSETGKTWEPLSDFRTTVPRWKRLNFLAPPGRYQMEIAKDGPDWIAFTQPTTDTRLAHASLTLASLGSWLFGGGALLGFAAGFVLLPRMTGGKPRGPESAPPSTAAPPPAAPDARLSLPTRSEFRLGAALREFRKLWSEAPFFAASICAGGVLLALFLRRPEMFLQPQLWAEDGPIFLLQADTWGKPALTSPYGGYHLLLPRLLAAASAGLDIFWIPSAYLVASLGTVLAVGFALFSPRIDLPYRAVCFLAIALLPHSGEVFGNLTNLQWLSALGLVWLLLARDAATPQQTLTDGLVAVGCGLTGIYSVLFTPLFAWRAWQRRSQASVIVLALIAICAAIQLTALAQPTGAPAVQTHLSVASVLAFSGLRLFAALVLPAAWAESLPAPVQTALGIATIALLALTAVKAGPRRDLRGILVGCVFLVLAATIYRAREDLAAFNSLANGDRYLFLPKLFIVWLLVCGWEGPWWVRAATRCACVLGLIATLSAWRFVPLHDYHWPEYAKRIQAGEAVNDIPINPPGMAFDHPGRR